LGKLEIGELNASATFTVQDPKVVVLISEWLEEKGYNPRNVRGELPEDEFTYHIYVKATEGPDKSFSVSNQEIDLVCHTSRSTFHR
jgi:hypothetical protein